MKRKSKVLEFHTMIKKICLYVGKNKEKMFGLTIVSLLICMLLSSWVSEFIFENVTKSHQVRIAAYEVSYEGENLPMIIDNYYEDTSITGIENVIESKQFGFYNFEQLKSVIVDSKDIRIVSAEDSEFGYGYFEFESSEAYIVFDLPVYPNTCLTVGCDYNIYGLRICDEASGYDRYIDYENTLDEVKSCKMYLYDISDYLYIFVWYIFLYILLFIGIFLLIILIERSLDILSHETNIFVTYNKSRIFLFIFLVYVIYTSVVYTKNIDVFQISEQSDAYYYLNPQIFNEEGKFSLQTISNYLYTFRGYFTIPVDLCLDVLSSLTGIGVMYFYFMYYGALTAFAIGVALPKLYESLTSRKANYAMCVAMFCLFFIFWHNFFFYPMTDIPAAMFAVSAISYIFHSLKSEKRSEMFLGALFIGIAISYRTAYAYVFYLLVLWFMVEFIIKHYRREKTLRSELTFVVALAAGLILVTWPQAILNYVRGHIGLFPYNAGWCYDPNSGMTVNATWSDFTQGLHSYGFLTMQNGDVQFANIDQIYYMDKYYSAGDLVYLIFANPIAFFMGYFKRLFWAMSAGMEGIYTSLPVPEWAISLTYMFGYLLIGNLLYLFVSRKTRENFNAKSKLFYVGMAVVTICIQNLVHIEKRYYMIFYLFIYFANAFFVIDYLKDREQRKEHISIRYILVMLVFVCAGYILKNMISYNFL